MSSFPTEPPPGPPPPGWQMPPDAIQPTVPSKPDAGWPFWQGAMLGVVGLLVGACLGLAAGVRMGHDPSSADTFEAVSPDPTDTTSTTSEDGGGQANAGTLSNPVHVGQRYLVGGAWLVRVNSVNPAASDIVVAESALNEPAGPNEAYVLIELGLTYTEEGYSGVPQEVLLSLQDSSGTQYFAFEHSCGRIPNPLTDYAEVPGGETITGNVCFAVPADQYDGMVLLAATAGGGAVHFALR